MKFISTRDKLKAVSGAEAIVKGISEDGGLFVPESFPVLTSQEILELISYDYPERAARIIGKFFSEFTTAELLDCSTKAYAKFDGDPAPLVNIEDGLYMLELYHGPTFAFKDIALTLLPYLMQLSKQKLHIDTHTLVLVATSGDTGKAALEGFKDVPGCSIAVLYPQDGVSQMQKLQMITTTGDNVWVSGISGNFDDAQTAIKEVFNSSEIAEEFKKRKIALSSANSINFGRLVPQIVYYFSVYADLLGSDAIKMGDLVNFSVPCGNFGNILAGYYAKQMGLPIGKLICASNANNVLTDFFTNGSYDANREFHKTTSPSMDILISSNLERLIFELSGRDDALTATRMKQLKTSGKYSITAQELAELSQNFGADCISESDVYDTIADTFDESGYLMDTHTAVAMRAATNYLASASDSAPMVVVSTASPYKFTESVLLALDLKVSDKINANLHTLEDETAMPIPETLINLSKMEKIHKGTITKQDVKKWVLSLQK